MTKRAIGLYILALVLLALGAVSYFVVQLSDSPPLPPQATLHFTSADETLRAELLPLNGDEPVQPAFQVKDSEPLTVPAGTYRLRLSGPGRLSETVLVDAVTGRETAQPVKLEDAALWPPLALLNGGEVLALDGRADIFQYTTAGLRRLHGATAKPVWDAVLDPALEKTGLRWRDVLSQDDNQRPHIVQTTADLDGDGSNDVLCLSHATPLLLALSGHDGSLLWAYRASDEGHGFGEPVAFDLDGKGVPVFFALFYTQQRCWLDAIAGDKGTRLWRAEMEPAWYAGEYQCQLAPGMSSNYPREVTRFPILVSQRDGKTIVSVVAGSTLVEWEARTGARLGDPWPLDRPRTGQADSSSGVTFEGVPLLGALLSSQFVDLKGDGGHDLFILRWHAAHGYDLLALSLTTRKTLWETTLHDSRAWWFAELDWPRVYRYGAGSATILVHNGSNGTTCAIDALDGATGRSRWKRRLLIDPRGQDNSYRLDRFLVGPDLDGDGRRDVFVTTLGMPHQRDGQPQHYLFVDALSGQDGKTLWTTRLRRPGALAQDQLRAREIRPLSWWQIGGDGWPQLLVPLRPGANEDAAAALSYVVSAGTGRIAQVLRGVSNAWSADFDGDGIPDLYWLTNTDQGRQLHATRGTHPEAWRRLGKWQPAGDLDGDGIADYALTSSTPASVVAVSGRDGHLLFEGKPQELPPPLAGSPHSLRNSNTARLLYQTENETICQLASLTPERETPRHDGLPRTDRDRFAEIVARYHLDWPAWALLLAATVAALVKRRWLLVVLVPLAVAIAHAVLWWCVPRTPAVEYDPRWLAEQTYASPVSQTATLAATLLLAGLTLWGLWRLFHWLGPKQRAARGW